MKKITFWRYADMFPDTDMILGGFVKVNYGNGIEDEIVEASHAEIELLTDPITGKPKRFFSMIHALNFMSEQGWELVQSKLEDSYRQNPYYRFIIRREESFENAIS